jgi:hypothetical protein
MSHTFAIDEDPILESMYQSARNRDCVRQCRQRRGQMNDLRRVVAVMLQVVMPGCIGAFLAFLMTGIMLGLGSSRPLLPFVFFAGPVVGFLTWLFGLIADRASGERFPADHHLRDPRVPGVLLAHRFLALAVAPRRCRTTASVRPCHCGSGWVAPSTACGSNGRLLLGGKQAARQPDLGQPMCWVCASLDPTYDSVASTPHQPAMNSAIVFVTFFSDSSSTRSLKPWTFSALAPKQNAGMPWSSP